MKREKIRNKKLTHNSTFGFSDTQNANPRNPKELFFPIKLCRR